MVSAAVFCADYPPCPAQGAAEKDEVSLIFHAKGVAAAQQKPNTKYCGVPASAAKSLSLQGLLPAPKAGSPASKKSYASASLIWRGFHIFRRTVKTCPIARRTLEFASSVQYKHIYCVYSQGTHSFSTDLSTAHVQPPAGHIGQDANHPKRAPCN